MSQNCQRCGSYKHTTDDHDRKKPWKSKPLDAKGRKQKFRVGQKVCRHSHGQRAKILRFMSGVSGGVVLDRAIDGFRCWNVDDLRPLTKREAGR